MNMDFELLDKSCRICLETFKKLRTIYEPLDEGDDPPIKMIQCLTDIQIEPLYEDNWLPKKICKNCISSLNVAYQFREKIIKAQNMLTKLCKNLNKTQQLDIKSECIVTAYDIEVLDDEFVKQSNEQWTQTTEAAKEYDIDNYVYNKQVEEEDEENVYVDNTQCLFDYTGDDYDDDDDDDEDDDDDDNDNDDDDDVDWLSNDIKKHNVNITKTQETKPTIKPKSSVEPNPPDVSAQNRFDKIQQQQQQKKYVDNEDKESKTKCNRFICDICGNIFTKRGRMMEHRSRHNNELIFTCEICDERFSQREKLRRHMLLHSGGRPLKCSYCNRTFYYESVKKSHESIHTGVKPYKCKCCNKSFAYAHTLKKHQLIHDDIKAYHCSYCDKDFRLDHHLKQHMETKLHQTAVRMAQENKT